MGDGDGADVGDLRLAFSRTDHPPVTLATRLDGPSSALGYSADSGPEWSFSAFGPGLDLALCEATYTAEHEGTARTHEWQTSRFQRPTGRRPAPGGHPPVADGAASAMLAEATETFGGHVEQAAVGRGYSL